MPGDDLKQVISQVATSAEESKKKAVEKIQLVIFELDSEEYAVNITDLREVIKIPQITSIPNSPEFIKGIINLRGKIVVVLDLEKRFSLVRENKVKPDHIIITELEGNNYGLIVDRVKEVIWVEKEKIQPTPELLSVKIKADYLKGVVVLEQVQVNKKVQKKVVVQETVNRLIVMLDLKKLLQEKELLSLGKTIKQVVK